MKKCSSSPELLEIKWPVDKCDCGLHENKNLNFTNSVVTSELNVIAQE